jgi:carbamoyl-phosphate synthase large subunit
MGIDFDFASSYAKAQIAAGQRLPMSGKVFISMADKYKADAVGIAKQLVDLGYGVVATRGTANTLMSAGEANVSGFDSNLQMHPRSGVINVNWNVPGCLQ